MKKFVVGASIIALLAIVALACGRNPVVTGTELGKLSCLIAVTESPEHVDEIAEGIEKALTVLNAPAPTLALLHAAIETLENPKAKLYATAVVSSVVLVFPEFEDTVALPDDVHEALVAALTECQKAVNTV